MKSYVLLLSYIAFFNSVIIVIFSNFATHIFRFNYLQHLRMSSLNNPGCFLFHGAFSWMNLTFYCAVQSDLDDEHKIPVEQHHRFLFRYNLVDTSLVFKYLY